MTPGQIDRLKLALDGASARSIDVDGHLHVASSVVTAACVSPYYGAEIPNGPKLGFAPDRVYQLLRDPDALRRAVPSLQGKPLLNVHRPQMAGQHDRGVVVGSVMGPKWNAADQTVTAELVIWDGTAIRDVESGAARGLSAGYRYRAVPSRGAFQGEPYDGLMVDIDFNHVALVEDPRVELAMVGDSKPRGLKMKRLMVMDAGQIMSPGGDMEEDTLQEIAKNLRSRFQPQQLQRLASLLNDNGWGATDARQRMAQPTNGLHVFKQVFPGAQTIRRVG